MANIYQTQLEASRQFADALFSSVEKIDQVLLAASHRACIEQLRFAQSLATVRDVQGAADAQAKFFSQRPDRAMNYHRELVRVLTEVQTEFGKSMRNYMEQMSGLGNEQVLSFPMKGDLFGVDGIHTKRHASEAVALSNCDLILLPFKKLTALGRTHAEFEHAMYSVMSRELVREQSMVSMLGALSAEARVARFLVSLSERYAEMGYSSKLFNLRMTRHEIGSYLGLTLETVSRTLSAFNEIGLISVDQRSIGIKDIEALKTLRRLPPSSSRAKQLAARKQRAAAAGTSQIASA